MCAGILFRLKRRFAEDGLEGAVKDRVQFHRYWKVNERAEAHLIILACSPASEGQDHWERRLLADRVVESLSHEAVRVHLKKLP